MTSKEPANDQQVREFEEALSGHGYGFQFAVIKEIERLRHPSEQNHGWLFEVSEFPVHVQGQGTRIDFILKYVGGEIYLLAECKQVNPAFGNWLFARAPESSLRSLEKNVRLQLCATGYCL